MNAAPALNLQVLRVNGQPLKSSGEGGKVCLINIIHKGDQLLFEPKLQALQAKGLSAQKALLTVSPSGNAPINVMPQGGHWVGEPRAILGD